MGQLLLYRARNRIGIRRDFHCIFPVLSPLLAIPHQNRGNAEVGALTDET